MVKKIECVKEGLKHGKKILFCINLCALAGQNTIAIFIFTKFPVLW